ncbi:COG1938 domain-containing protein [Naegleria gruberi]|uniref:COG1938 domain-containing protein n=1 Tax=Naegleria gruberi TaxID=5762 RepID=D2V7L9_NAEGR|nr:COG1938 domain-containing protein [Naegleria gruberi]EFC47272.1 COG1938 domain-containing protein [Naegleria gruberi]|eukprot:XP_002680016.1 COG1938 domain-containing protein [Naegleria gruberi strain NEG-M]
MQQLNTNLSSATTGQEQPHTPKTPKTPGSFPVVAATGKSSQDEAVPIFCRQYKIICKNSIGKVVLREFDSIECDGTVVIEGFPSEEGMTAIMTANYIIKQLQLPLVGDIVSPYFTPLGVVRDGLPSHGIRIYGNKKIVVFVSEYEIKDPEIQNDVIDAVYDFCQRHRSKCLISVDGLDMDPTVKKQPSDDIKIGIQAAGGAGEEGDDEEGEDEEGDEMMSFEDEDAPKTTEELLKLLEQEDYKEKVWYVTNNEHYAKKLQEMNATVAIEVACTGISGGILAEAPFRGVPVLSLFAPLNRFLKIGTRASIALIHALNKLISEDQTSILIDTSELDKTAKELESKLKDVLGKMGATGDEKVPVLREKDYNGVKVLSSTKDDYLKEGISQASCVLLVRELEKVLNPTINNSVSTQPALETSAETKKLLEKGMKCMENNDLQGCFNAFFDASQNLDDPTIITEYFDKLYKAGFTDEKSYALLMEYFLIQAETGDAFSSNMIGQLHCGYCGHAKESKKALLWFEKAAKQGEVSAQFNLAKLYLDGDGEHVPIDYSNALKWFRRAGLENSHPDSLYYLCTMYEKGLGVSADLNLAEEYFERAKALGSILTQ